MNGAPWCLATVAMALALALCGLAACGERSQGEPARLKKADSKPSAGAVATDKAYMASGWTAGDDTSWQAQIRSRAQGQNEYARITAATSPAATPAAPPPAAAPAPAGKPAAPSPAKAP